MNEIYGDEWYINFGYKKEDIEEDDSKDSKDEETEK